MNGVLVKMANGDSESFKTATSFSTAVHGINPDHGQWLHVLQGEQELGVFPPGSWSGVRYFEGYMPAKGAV